jgi:hypothetical protein
MRIVRQFFAACALTCTLAMSMHAGVISTPVAPPEPDLTPATTQGEMTTGIAGDMHTTNSEAAGDSVAADVVGLVVDVLSSLF